MKNIDEYVKEKEERIQEYIIIQNHGQKIYWGNFIRTIIEDRKPKMSKKRIIEIENLLIDVANGNTGVILASARIQGWLMEAGVEMENK